MKNPRSHLNRAKGQVTLMGQTVLGLGICFGKLMLRINRIDNTSQSKALSRVLAEDDTLDKMFLTMQSIDMSKIKFTRFNLNHTNVYELVKWLEVISMDFL